MTISLICCAYSIYGLFVFGSVRRIKRNTEYSFNIIYSYFLLRTEPIFFLSFYCVSELQKCFSTPRRMFVLIIMEANVQNVLQGQFYFYTRNKEKSLLIYRQGRRLYQRKAAEKRSICFILFAQCKSIRLTA